MIQGADRITLGVRGVQKRICIEEIELNGEYLEVEGVRQMINKATQTKSGNLNQIWSLENPPGEIRDVLEGMLMWMDQKDSPGQTVMKILSSKSGENQIILNYNARDLQFKAIAYETQMVSEVTPGKGDKSHLGLPIFKIMPETKASTRFNSLVVYDPPPFAAKAVLEAAEIDLAVRIPRGIPQHDTVRVKKKVMASPINTRLIGPNCSGRMKHGKCKIKSYKIGPDPSSIDSCMIGGIVNNNSSGMCCGISQNTYHTLQDMRVVFVDSTAPSDGAVLDTADPESRNNFLEQKDLVAGVIRLASNLQSDRELSNLIRRKFMIKCTTGYSLNALVDFPVADPIKMIKCVIIGSEGTFAFVSRATYNTVPEGPHKASAFLIFPHLNDAFMAAHILREKTPVDAVGLFDRACLRECKIHDKMPKLVPEIAEDPDPMAAALLIECRGPTPEALQQSIAEIYNVYWDVRKGLIPMVGAARETGTSMLIEDVACPIENLAEMTMDFNDMFERYGYTDACCLGHALEGNLHLIFSQGFRTKDQVQTFCDMMEEMAYIVATKHSGSLKGEHGTGTNMAPFVEMEWGSKAYELMWELKELFDPTFVLNPGVFLNRDPATHVKHLKPSPPASDIVDRCIECGFCESNCPSKDLTLTPRQRIREISRLRSIDNKIALEDSRLKEFEQLYSYQGEQTCAVDGMCQEKCPVKINTGDFIKSLRVEELEKSKTARGLAMIELNDRDVVEGVLMSMDQKDTPRQTMMKHSIQIRDCNIVGLLKDCLSFENGSIGANGTIVSKASRWPTMRIEDVENGYTHFEGKKENKTSQKIAPANKKLLVDGAVLIEAVEVQDDIELKGKVLDSKIPRCSKNCNLVGVKVDIPVMDVSS
ncbi:hypothetical protein BSKO_06798 [Bryopsis sp. KO-2023]|nr:hypothetical protein BSKO_06798 [Bryopsis sp. KO-2023]